MADYFSVTSSKAVAVPAEADDQKRITNSGGGTAYYKATADVSASDTALTVGSSVVIDSIKFLISASESNIIVESAPQDVSAEDLTVTDDASVGDALTVTGGITQATAPHGFHNWQPIAATSGTDTTPAADTQFVTSVFVPVNKTLTGYSYLIGSVGGTDKVYVVLYDADGAVLANSSLTSGGATVGTAANAQAVAFTATYAAKGPRLYYVGVSMNGNTARLRTVPAFTSGGIFGGSVTQVHGTVAAITEPVTFTADKAPIGFLY